MSSECALKYYEIRNVLRNVLLEIVFYKLAKKKILNRVVNYSFADKIIDILIPKHYFSKNCNHGSTLANFKYIKKTPASFRDTDGISFAPIATR